MSDLYSKNCTPGPSTKQPEPSTKPSMIFLHRASLDPPDRFFIFGALVPATVLCHGILEHLRNRQNSELGLRLPGTEGLGLLRFSHACSDL